jgi:hypothetical protein
MLSGEHLRTAEARVREVCALLTRPSSFNLELCGPLLEGIRQLLAAPGNTGPAEASGALLHELTRAGVLARHAAELYQDSIRLGAAGASAYTAQGGPAIGGRPARILAEG